MKITKIDVSNMTTKEAIQLIEQEYVRMEMKAIDKLIAESEKMINDHNVEIFDRS